MWRGWGYTTRLPVSLKTIAAAMLHCCIARYIAEYLIVDTRPRIYLFLSSRISCPNSSILQNLLFLETCELHVDMARRTTEKAWGRNSTSYGNVCSLSLIEPTSADAMTCAPRNPLFRRKETLGAVETGTGLRPGVPSQEAF